EFSRNDIATTYKIPIDRIDVVYNGVSEAFAPLSAEEKQTARSEYASSDPYFVCVGSLHPRKNIARLLAAFDRLIANHHLPHRLVIVGENFWWDDRMKAAWEKLKHKNRIHFTGRLQQQALSKALGGAEALVFISYFEGFG